MNERGITDVVPVEDAPAAVVQMQSAEQRLNEFIRMAPKLATRYFALRKASLETIGHQTFWYQWGDKYRMTGEAAASLIAAIGIEETWMDNPRKEEMPPNEKNPDGYYIIWVQAIYRAPWGGKIVGLGSCQSDDPFVATRYAYDKEAKKRVRKDLPPEEVDYTNVVKAAKANARVNGVSELLGLKNVTVEDLTDAFQRQKGADLKKIERVGFEKQAWQPTDKQKEFASSLGATEDEVAACKNVNDFNRLITSTRKKKDARKKERKEASAAPPPEEGGEQGSLGV